MKNLRHTLESCWLCMRFPFLYPRNRWTGTHWYSWKIHEYLWGVNKNGIYDKAFEQIPKPNRQYDFETIDKVKSLPWAIWFYIVYWTYKYFLKYFLPIFHCIPEYTELDAMPGGWRKAFGLQMCDELKKQLKKEHYLYKYRIIDIKEKWGYLHWYDAGHSEEIEKIIRKYENTSEHTCIVCGKKATRRTVRWISPYCDECCPDQKYEKIHEERN